MMKRMTIPSRLGAWITIQALLFGQIPATFADTLRVAQPESKTGLEEIERGLQGPARTGLEEIPAEKLVQVRDNLQAILGRDPVREIRWPKEMSPQEIEETVRGATLTMAAIAIQEDAPFGDPAAFRKYVLKRFGVRAVVIAGGRSRRFSKDSFEPKVLYRVDGTSTVVKQALEAARVNAPEIQREVQDMAALRASVLYWFLAERPIDRPEREKLIGIVEDRLEDVFRSMGVAPRAREAARRRVLEALRGGLRWTRTERRGDFRWTLQELERRLAEVRALSGEPRVQEGVADEVAYLLMTELLKSPGAVDRARQAELVGDNVALVCTSVGGPASSFYHALDALEGRGLLDQTRYVMPVYGDYAPAVMDRFPHVYAVGLLTALNQLGWQYKGQPRFREDRLLRDAAIRELPALVWGVKSPLDEKGVTGRGQVMTVPTDYGEVAAQNREWKTLSPDEQRQRKELEAESRRSKEESRRTGQPYRPSHAVNGGVFLFEGPWAIRAIEQRIFKEEKYRHTAPDADVMEYWWTDLVELAHEDARARWAADPAALPVVKTALLGEETPSGVGDQRAAEAYGAEYAAMVRRELAKIPGLTVDPDAKVVIWDRRGSLYLPRDLPRIFQGKGIRLSGQVRIEAGSVIADGVHLTDADVRSGLEETDAPTALLPGSVVERSSVAGCWIAGTVRDSTLKNAVVAPGETVQGATPEKRLEDLARIVEDPQRFVAGVARLGERSPETRAGLIAFMRKEILAMIDDKILGTDTRAQAVALLNDLLAHPAAMRLTNEELYRMAFLMLSRLSSEPDPFARDKEGPERDRVREFAAGLITKAAGVQKGDPRVQLEQALDEITLRATQANFFDRQSATARAVFGRPGFFDRDRFETNLAQAIDPSLGIDGRAEWHELALDTEEPGTFLYLVDNMEETEVDVALWVFLAQLGHRVVVAAKSTPARADATVADVRQMIEAHPPLKGLLQRGAIRVIGTGTQTYGTLLDRASGELAETLTDPALRAVISKGQGNLYTTVTRNALQVPVVCLLLSKGRDAALATGVTGKLAIPVIAVVPSGRHILDPVPDRPGEFQGTLKELVEEGRRLDQVARASANYQALVRVFGAQDQADRAIRAQMRRSRRSFAQVVLGDLHPESLARFLSRDPEGFVERQRALERYDAISFGGGSASQTIQETRQKNTRLRESWAHTVSVTNGTDNGGRTAKIQKAMEPVYGHTFTVGDITAAFRGMFPNELQDRVLELDQKVWENGYFWGEQAVGTKDDIALVAKSLVSKPPAAVPPTFAARLEWLLTDFARDPQRFQDNPDFVRLAVELMNLASAADQAFIGPDLAHPRVHDVNLPSVRHAIFNAILVAVGAYDEGRKTVNQERFRVGLFVLERAFGLPHRILHNSLDPLELYAELTDPKGGGIWNSTQTFAIPEAPGSPEPHTVKERGQVAISLSPDSVKPGKARYGAFGFIDPQRASAGEIVLVEPTPERDVIQAIRQAREGALVIFGPSSFVVSLSSIFLSDFIDALDARPDLAKVLILPATRNGETLGWTAYDYLRFWERHVTHLPLEKTVDYVVLNTRQPLPRAVEEAAALAEAAGSAQHPNYSDVLDQFNERPGIKQAIDRLKEGGAAHADDELALALAFADHGEGLKTYKKRGGLPAVSHERGGVPPLRGAELQDLAGRGITVVGGDLVVTEGIQYVPGEGRTLRRTALLGQERLGAVFEIVETEHRHRLQQTIPAKRAGVITLPPRTGLEEFAAAVARRLGVPEDGLELRTKVRTPGGMLFRLFAEQDGQLSVAARQTPAGKWFVPIARNVFNNEAGMANLDLWRLRRELAGSRLFRPGRAAAREIDWVSRTPAELTVRIARTDLPDKEEVARQKGDVPHSYVTYRLVDPQSGREVASLMLGFSPLESQAGDLILADVTMDPDEFGDTGLDARLLEWAVAQTIGPSVQKLWVRHWTEWERDPHHGALLARMGAHAAESFRGRGREPFQEKVADESGFLRIEPGEDLPTYDILLTRAPEAGWTPSRLPEGDLPDRPVTLQLVPPQVSLTGLEESEAAFQREWDAVRHRIESGSEAPARWIPDILRLVRDDAPYWWFGEAAEFLRERAQPVPQEVLEGLAGVITDGLDRYRQHAVLWLVHALASRGGYVLAQATDVPEELRESLAEAERRVRELDDRANEQQIREMLEDPPATLTPLARQGANKFAYRATWPASGEEPARERVVKVTYIGMGIGGPFFHRFFTEFSDDDERIQASYLRGQLQEKGKGRELVPTLYEEGRRKLPGVEFRRRRDDHAIYTFDPVVHVEVEEAVPGEDLQTVLDQGDPDAPAAVEAARLAYREIWQTLGWAIPYPRPEDVVVRRSETGEWTATVVDLDRFEKMDETTLEERLAQGLKAGLEELSPAAVPAVPPAPVTPTLVGPAAMTATANRTPATLTVAQQALADSARQRINLLPQLTLASQALIAAGTLGIIAGPEDDRGLAAGVAISRRAVGPGGQPIPVLFITKDEAQYRALMALGVSEESILRVGVGERYATVKAAVDQATAWLRGMYEASRVIPLGVDSRIPPQMIQVLRNVFGVELEENESVEAWEEAVEEAHRLIQA